MLRKISLDERRIPEWLDFPAQTLDELRGGLIALGIGATLYPIEDAA